MSTSEALSGIEHERLMIDYFDSAELLSTVITYLDSAARTVPRAGDGYGTRGHRVSDDAKALHRRITAIYNDLADLPQSGT